MLIFFVCLQFNHFCSFPEHLALGATCAKVAKTIDTGAGFFIEEETAEDEQQERRVVHQPGELYICFYKLMNKNKWSVVSIKCSLVCVYYSPSDGAGLSDV